MGGAGVGPVTLLRDLARLRATAVCDMIARRVPGIRTSVRIATKGEVLVADPQSPLPGQTQPQSPTQSRVPLRISASTLSRRVVVVAYPGDAAVRP